MSSLPDGMRAQETVQLAFTYGTRITSVQGTGDEENSMNYSRQAQAILYSEDAAARELGISLARLYQLLDDHLFNDGSTRPENMTFQYADLLLLEFWKQNSAIPKVVRMPRPAR